MLTRNQDPRYKFNPLYRNHFKEGLFVSDRNAELPEPVMYDVQYDQFGDFASDMMNGYQYSEQELDAMVMELQAKGY